MQIYIQGTATPEQVVAHMKAVISDLLGRIEAPSNTTYKLVDVEFKVGFDFGDGTLQYAGIKREVGGEMVDEIFQVAVLLDENGEIKFSEDNENESFHDGYTLAQAAGVEYEYEGIESMYDNDDLEVLDYIEDSEEDDKKVMAARYKIKGTEKILVRYFKGEKLVAEKVFEGIEDSEE